MKAATFRCMKSGGERLIKTLSIKIVHNKFDIFSADLRRALFSCKRRQSLRL